MNIKNMLFATVVAGFMVSGVSASQEKNHGFIGNLIEKARAGHAADAAQKKIFLPLANTELYGFPIRNVEGLGYFVRRDTSVIRLDINGFISVITAGEAAGKDWDSADIRFSRDICEEDIVVQTENSCYLGCACDYPVAQKAIADIKKKQQEAKQQK